MQPSLIYTRGLFNNIAELKRRTENLAKEIVRLAGQAEYDQTIKLYDGILNKLTEEMKSLPIGYRYKGTYYLKKPYSNPIVFEKKEGSIFMREDLITWEIENEDKRYNYRVKAVYKEPDFTTELTRKDAVPVYND